MAWPGRGRLGGVCMVGWLQGCAWHGIDFFLAWHGIFLSWQRIDFFWYGMEFLRLGANTAWKWHGNGMDVVWI